MKKEEGQKAIKSSTAYIKQPCKFIPIIIVVMYIRLIGTITGSYICYGLTTHKLFLISSIFLLFAFFDSFNFNTLYILLLKKISPELKVY